MFVIEFSRKNYLKGNDFRNICGVVPRNYEFPKVQRVGAPDTAHICRISRLADHLRKKKFALQLSQNFNTRRRKITYENLSFYWLFQFTVSFSINITQSEFRGHCEAHEVFSSEDGQLILSVIKMVLHPLFLQIRVCRPPVPAEYQINCFFIVQHVTGMVRIT